MISRYLQKIISDNMQRIDDALVKEEAKAEDFDDERVVSLLCAELVIFQQHLLEYGQQLLAKKG